MPKGVGYPSTSPKTKSLLSKKPVKKNPEKGMNSDMLSADSASVSKEEYKRFDRIFTDSIGRHDLDDIEVHNAYVLMKNKKDFSDHDIKVMISKRASSARQRRKSPTSNIRK